MRQYLWAWMLLCGAVAVMPGPANAQHFRRGHRCCDTCQLPQASCTCSQTRPVVQTQLRAQQVTTFRDVTETHVRNETVVQNVPVTTYKQVTVDEGGYQMVWVPKPVTKQVAQTVIQQQAQTRAVPYQVTRRIPQVSTQLVPVQTVQHVTETVPMVTTWAPPPVTFRATSGCNTCDAPLGTAFATPVYPLPQYGAAMAPPMQFAPSTASIQTLPPISVPLPQTALAPTPTPTTEQWQTIPSRTNPSTSSYESPGVRSVPVPMDEASNFGTRTGKFVPAPTAATVWSSRQGTTFR
ncbi:MAG: hypothetical protein JSS49_03380 [Planctomycetes bacterium]|nr:hypothetical protein [Planctomycetota bacterium]